MLLAGVTAELVAAGEIPISRAWAGLGLVYNCLAILAGSG